MARPKEFDRDAAIGAAMRVFWAKGYEAASTDELLAAMRIGRQSMYDTFGDKQGLYFEALRRYHRENGGATDRGLTETRSPLEGIRRLLLALAERGADERARGCMGINATTAFGQFFPDVTRLAAGTASIVEGALERAVAAAQAGGELSPTLDARMAAQFLYTNLQGLTVRAQAGASQESLRNAAGFAITALASMN